MVFKVRKRLFVIFLLTIYCAGHINAVNSSDKLIGNNVSVFYPSHYDALSHSPSFALLKEPKVTGTIPSDWNLTPVFYTKGGKSYATLVRAVRAGRGTSVRAVMFCLASRP